MGGVVAVFVGGVEVGIVGEGSEGEVEGSRWGLRMIC